MLAILAIVFLVLLCLGVPIAFSMGLASFASMLCEMPQAIITIPSKMFGGLDSFSLMAIPFFLLAGNLMDACGISKKLVDFAELLVGWIKGGLAMVVVVASVIFAAITGSASAAASAIGAILISSLVAKGYKKGFSSALVASGGTIGPVIPPSILAVLYSSATGLSVGALFMAGVVPGVLMALALIVNCIIYVRKHPEVSDSGTKKPFRECVDITLKALPAFMMPVIIIGGILSGVFTATESAAIGCIYSAIVGFATKTMTVKKCWNVLYESALSVSRLMLIVSCATLFGWILSVKQFPAWIAGSLTAFTDNRWVVMILLIGILLIVGCFMETIAALNILVPVLYPIGVAYGFNDIHFAMVIMLTLLFGAITPPVGILLYISSGIAKIPFVETVRYIVPFLISLFIVVLLVAIFPALSTALPTALGF